MDCVLLLVVSPILIVWWIVSDCLMSLWASSPHSPLSNSRLSDSVWVCLCHSSLLTPVRLGVARPGPRSSAGPGQTRPVISRTNKCKDGSQSALLRRPAVQGISGGKRNSKSVSVGDTGGLGELKVAGRGSVWCVVCCGVSSGWELGLLGHPA